MKNKQLGKDLNKFNYQIKESKDNSDDSIIRKVGIQEVFAEFSINDIKRDIQSLNKNKKEQEAKRDFEQAKIENVKARYEHIAKMDEKDRIAASIFQISTESVRVCDKYISAIEEQLDKYAKEIEEITKQTGLCPKEIKQ